jgi:hypothetical protein
MPESKTFIEQTQPINILEVMGDALLERLIDGYCLVSKTGIAVYYPVELLRQMNVDTARLRVKQGESIDVIAGANILSRWGVPDIDVPILRYAKKRKGFSAETYETLERAISDLKNKHK